MKYMADTYDSGIERDSQGWRSGFIQQFHIKLAEVESNNAQHLANIKVLSTKKAKRQCNSKTGSDVAGSRRRNKRVWTRSDLYLCQVERKTKALPRSYSKREQTAIYNYRKNWPLTADGTREIMKRNWRNSRKAIYCNYKN